MLPNFFLHMAAVDQAFSNPNIIQTIIQKHALQNLPYTMTLHTNKSPKSIFPLFRPYAVLFSSAA